MTDADLDAAVRDFAERFRAALEPPAQAGVTIDRGVLAARFDEPLPEHGIPLGTILGELEARSAGGLAGGTGGRYFGYVTGGALPAAAIVGGLDRGRRSERRACGRSARPASSSSR